MDNNNLSKLNIIKAYSKYVIFYCLVQYRLKKEYFESIFPFIILHIRLLEKWYKKYSDRFVFIGDILMAI